MDKYVVVASGLPFSGKSSFLGSLLKLEHFRNAAVVRTDEIRARLFGDRPDDHITRTEHLFKNELARTQVLEFLIRGAQTVLTEAVMLTQSGHQRPFVEMIARAQIYLHDIERECRQRDNLPPPSFPIRVHLRVVLLFASPDVTLQRTASIADRIASSASVFNLPGMKNALAQFEYPEPIYTPLLLDTSDQSSAAEKGRLAETIDFVRHGVVDPARDRERKRVMLYYRNQLIEMIGCRLCHE